MTENPPPPRGDRPESGDDFPPYPGGSGGEQSPGGQQPPPGQYGPPGGQSSGGQYGPPPGPPPAGGQYGPPPSGGQYGPPPSGGQYGPPPSGGQYGPPGGGQYGPPGGGQYDSPPGGGYGPPPNYGSPQGGYPPPPGFGNDPYPGGGGYGPGNFGGPPQLSVGAALSYGWEKFKSNAGVWVGITVIAFLISGAIQFVFGGFNYDTTDLGSTFRIWNLVGILVSTIVGYLIQAAFVRGSLLEVDGNRPAFGSFFQFANVGAVILACLLISIATFVGLILCVLPGLLVMFLTWFTLQFVIDQNQDAITAIKSSYAVISKNGGPLVGLALASVGINIVGALLCGLGLLVTGPVTLIASTYAYRVLVRGPISAPTA